MNTISRNGYEFSVQHCMEITVWRVGGGIQRWSAATVKPLRRVSIDESTKVTLHQKQKRISTNKWLEKRLRGK